MSTECLVHRPRMPRLRKHHDPEAKANLSLGFHVRECIDESLRVQIIDATLPRTRVSLIGKEQQQQERP
jgi:hypothetical protein